MVNRAYTPERGDILYINLNPTKGHEQAHTRPAIALSPKAYNRKAGIVLLVPITAQEKGYPFEVAIYGKTISGVALVDHVRSIDYHAHAVRYVEQAPRETIQDIQEKLCVLVKGM
jgi:mRNA interferase MazF